MFRLLTIVTLMLLFTACGGGSSDKLTQSALGELILTQTHGDAGSAWGKQDCDACHAIKVIHKNASATIQYLSKNKGYQACAGCHGSNGTSIERQCTTCHNNIDLPSSPLTDGGKVHHFKGEESALLNDKECIICHESSDMNGRFDINADLTHFDATSYSSEAQFCQSCHNRAHQQDDFPITGKDFDDPLIAIEDDYKYFDYHGFRDGSGQGTYNGLRKNYQYPQVVDCTDCHAMHGTQNNQLIIDSSRKGVKQIADSIRNRPYSVYTDGTNGTQAGDYGQLCVLCHNMEVINDSGNQDAGNGLKGVHEVDSDCRDCHTHGEATQIGL